MRYISPLLFLLSFLFIQTAFAHESYALPYPSAMPGNKTYVLHQVEEKIMRFWYFGDFGQLTYNRQLSDKYLVEAKTLFEYQQFPLALRALKHSDDFFRNEEEVFSKTAPSKNGRQAEGILLQEEAVKHKEVLIQLENSVPSIFSWQDEKRPIQHLDLKRAIENAISLRLSAI